MQCQALHMHCTYSIPTATLQSITGPILQMRRQTCTWNSLDELGPAQGLGCLSQKPLVERETLLYEQPRVRLLVVSDRALGPSSCCPEWFVSMRWNYSLTHGSSTASCAWSAHKKKCTQTPVPGHVAQPM